MATVKSLIGKKIGMTRVFDDAGNSVPVTALEVGPCVVVQDRGQTSASGDGVVQIGFGERKLKKTNRPLKGHFDSGGVSPKNIIKDVELESGADCEPGQELTVDEFADVSRVDVTGKSKGRGFAGVIKRHGFSGGPATHGSKFHRRPGSAGPGTSPGRVIKGRKMPGRMGNERKTSRNLKVVKVDAGRNLLLVKGSVPGSRGGYVIVTKAGPGDSSAK